MLNNEDIKITALSSIEFYAYLVYHFELGYDVAI